MKRALHAVLDVLVWFVALPLVLVGVPLGFGDA
jgi:hypothetical protein